MALCVTFVIYLLFFGLLFPPAILDETPVVLSVAMSISLAISIAIFYHVFAHRTPTIVRPPNPLGHGYDPDCLDLWAWQYARHSGEWTSTWAA